MLNYLPRHIQSFLVTMGGLFQYTSRFFREIFKSPLEWQEFLKQLFRLGVNSLLLVSITGFIIGMVMTLQMEPTMEQFGAESWLPSMVSISIVREIGPVLTALIVAGKVGSGIGAELGSMKVTEQVDAMQVSGANAFNYLVVTRVLACTVAVPLLVFYSDTIALAGSFVGVNMDNSVSLSLFKTQALDSLVFTDIIPATIKSVFFGFAIGIISCYRGINTGKGTMGVGDAANSSVVMSSLFIFVIDLIAVQITQIVI